MDAVEPNLDWTEIVAERKIQEAMEAGEFEDLPGKGKPIDLDSDPYTPAHLRIANRILKNSRALPAWMQTEKDIERETMGLSTNRERGLRAIRAARNPVSQERTAIRLRETYRESLDLINTLVLNYNYNAPGAAQKAFRRFNISREMAELEADIKTAAGNAAQIS